MTAETRSLAAPQHGGLAAGHERPGISNPVLGMILFITSEVMFFAGLFAAYFNVRASAPAWPPAGNAHFEIHHDVWPLVATLTRILIISSITCQLGIRAIQRDDRRGLARALAVTLALGITFLIGQAYDYSQLGFGLSDGTFGTTFFTLTGFHGAHVLAGTIMLGVMLYRATAGQFSARHHDAVEAVSLYWHFVDVVWICLFSILYLL
ncbi:MAG: cytochrome c oxidase subunit 3 [Candidatus Limnocylindrales bacterium]